MIRDLCDRQFRRAVQFAAQLHRHRSRDEFHVRFENAQILRLCAIICCVNERNTRLGFSQPSKPKLHGSSMQPSRHVPFGDAVQWQGLNLVR